MMETKLAAMTYVLLYLQQVHYSSFSNYRTEIKKICVVSHSRIPLYLKVQRHNPCFETHKILYKCLYLPNIRIFIYKRIFYRNSNQLFLLE